MRKDEKVESRNGKPASARQLVRAMKQQNKLYAEIYGGEHLGGRNNAAEPPGVCVGITKATLAWDLCLAYGAR